MLRKGLYLLLTLTLFVLAGCQDGGQGGEVEYVPVFGDNLRDTSPVIARVNGLRLRGRRAELGHARPAGQPAAHQLPH